MTSWNKFASKVVSWDKAQEQVNNVKKQGGKVVFTNGCFDILHLGHLEYLSKASDLGTYFIIAVNSDASVKRLKGPTRPINNTETRSLILAALEFVDAIVVFEEDTPKQVIDHLIPTVLVKGGDYKKEDIVGAQCVEENGGEVRVIPFKDGYSTTNVVTKIQNLSKQ